MSIDVKCNNVEVVECCQMQQCRRCQSLSNATMSKMSIFVKCKVITKSPNHPFLPHFLIFFNKGQETHNPQSAASTPSYTETPKYSCIAAYRRRKHRRPLPQTPPIAAANTAALRRCRVLPRVRPPPHKNMCIFVVCLRRLSRRSLRRSLRRAVLHEVRPYNGD